MQHEQKIDYARRTISIEFQTYKKLAELTMLKKIVGYRSSQVGELSIAIDRYYEEEMKTLKPKVKPNVRAKAKGEPMFELVSVECKSNSASSQKQFESDEVTPQQLRELAISLLKAAESSGMKQTIAVVK